VFAVYVALVVSAIFFATWQTQLSKSATDVESRISVLETEYYDAIAKLNSTDVALAGFGHPAHVDYVAASGKPTVTFVPKATR
jgi:hypothetical protein